MDIFLQKAEMRQKYLRIRNDVPADELAANSARIKNFLCDTDFYNECGEIFIYYGVNGEVLTDAIINAALKIKKTVALPVVLKKTKKTMEFYKISSADNLVKHKFGMYEPVPDGKNLAECGARTLIIAPGLVFSKDGRRVGYGGGYYDKYLAGHNYLTCAALCLDVQLDKSVPADESDMKMDFIITESGVHNCGRV